MKPFAMLVEEAARFLEGPPGKREEELGHPWPEVQAGLALPGGQNPVARALHLGWEALAHLVKEDLPFLCSSLLSLSLTWKTSARGRKAKGKAPR